MYLHRPWIMRMRWVDLLFAHWPVDAGAVGALLPPALDLDTYDGQAWLGIVPFRMEDAAPRGLQSPPGFGAFPEVNLRTYVRHRGRGGVWFLSLDGASRVTVEGARRFFHLPYFHAEMSATRDGPAIDYRSRRTDQRGLPAEIGLRYRPTGPVEPAVPGSLEAWLTDRLRAFGVDRDGRVVRTEVRHAPWSLQPAEAEIQVESLVAAQGLRLPATPPHLRYSERIDVRGWWPRRD